MRKVPISSIADVTAGQGAPKPDEFSDSGIPFVRAGSLEELIAGKSESDLEMVPAETAKKRKLKLYPKGSILFAKSGMSATKDRIYVLQNPAHVVSHLAILTPKDNVHRDYLRLALKQFPPSSLIKDPAYPAIGLGEIQGYEIPVPEELDDQKRIAHLLGKVEGLIARRKHHLQQLDDLLKSVFLEMFGDPVRNEKGWEVNPLTEITELVVDCPHSTPKWTDQGIVCLRTSNLGLGVWNWNDTRFVDEEQYKTRTARCEIIDGDIVLSREGTVGIAAMIRGGLKVCMGQRLVQVRANLKITNPYYLLRFLLLELAPERISRIMAGSTSQHLNLKDLRSLKCITPPIVLQNQFASIVEKIDALKSRYQQSLTDLESLYGALSQKAFKGELDLSRVPLPNESKNSHEGTKARSTDE